MPVQFVATVPDYEIVDGNMHIIGGDWSLCMSLRNFEVGMARASAIIAKHRLERLPGRGKVVPLPRGHRSA